MASKFTTIRFNAKNDYNGNPRRVFVTFENGEIVSTHDEEYNGIMAIKNRYHRMAYKGYTIQTTAAEYNALVGWKK